MLVAVRGGLFDQRRIGPNQRQHDEEIENHQPSVRSESWDASFLLPKSSRSCTKRTTLLSFTNRGVCVQLRDVRKTHMIRPNFACGI